MKDLRRTRSPHLKNSESLIDSIVCPTLRYFVTPIGVVLQPKEFRMEECKSFL